MGAHVLRTFLNKEGGYMIIPEKDIGRGRWNIVG